MLFLADFLNKVSYITGEFIVNFNTLSQSNFLLEPTKPRANIYIFYKMIISQLVVKLCMTWSS